LEKLNSYGDELIETTGFHGADIASQRMDDLDESALLHAIKVRSQAGVALDIGSGSGIQGLRFASLGIKSVLVDIIPAEQTVLKIRGLSELLPLAYLQKDANLIVHEDLPKEILFVYSQRFIHYLRYDRAVELFLAVRSRMKVGAKLFLSASGINTELADEYSALNQPISLRYGKLSEAMCKKHGIFEPVCLYSSQDIKQLSSEISMSCQIVYESKFGNIKAILVAT